MDSEQQLPPIAPDPYQPYPSDGGGGMQWHVIFGAISLVIAVFGMCMQGFGLVGVVANQQLMEMAGLEVSPPPTAVVWAGGLQATVLLLLGILLLVGSVLLLRRKSVGARLVLGWAVARLVMVVVGVVIAIVLIKPQTEWAVTLSSEIRDSMRSQGVAEDRLPPLLDEAKAQSDAVRNLAIFSIAFAVWPFTMALLLTREKARRDIEAWQAAEHAV